MEPLPEHYCRPQSPLHLAPPPLCLPELVPPYSPMSWVVALPPTTRKGRNEVRPLVTPPRRPAIRRSDLSTLSVGPLWSVREHLWCLDSPTGVPLGPLLSSVPRSLFPPEVLVRTCPRLRSSHLPVPPRCVNVDRLSSFRVKTRGKRNT